MAASMALPPDTSSSSAAAVARKWGVTAAADATIGEVREYGD
jgi:hypothetical protein